MKEILGFQVNEVAAALWMSPRTIERYVSKVFILIDFISKLAEPLFNIIYYNLGIIVNLKSTELSQKFLLLTNKLVI